MRVGVLTGGGDCPGLNAVIRAVVRKGVKEYGYEFVGFRDGWKGPLEGLTSELGVKQVRGILPARRDDPGLLAHQPVQGRGRRRADQAQPRRARRRRARGDRRRGHPRGRHQAPRPRRQRGRRPQDDRQRPQRDRLHLRLRHRGERRDGGHRPAAHDRRVAPPRARGRGDGPPRRLDRAARGHRRWRQRRAHPRAALRHRGGLRARGEPVQDRVLADHRGLRGRRAQGDRGRGRHDPGLRREGRLRPRPARRHRRPARPRDRAAHREGGAGRRTRSHPAGRHARRPSTAGWPPGSGCTRSTPSTTATSAR